MGADLHGRRPFGAFAAILFAALVSIAGPLTGGLLVRAAPVPALALVTVSPATTRVGPAASCSRAGGVRCERRRGQQSALASAGIRRAGSAPAAVWAWQAGHAQSAGPLPAAVVPPPSQNNPAKAPHAAATGRSPPTTTGC